MAKNIILLSDGTGNSAAKANRTNVWRFYRALDLTTPDQIAFYDDGVGTQNFLPFKFLGGAFGLGLARNVRQLYAFLCRSYSKGDRIYLFGFSRGAFTVRLLVGLIIHQGILHFRSDEALRQKVKEAYKTFRKDRFRRGLSRGIRHLRGVTDSAPQVAATAPNIKFIGVWDTVDAYGMPVDELATAFDYFIYPLRLPDQKLSKKVIKAAHALAIDDERHTFHPVLWDEKGEPPGRIEQVWFAGSHSNVGGGYPKNELSLVSLDWMISKVESKSGLRFIRSERASIREQAYVHGKMYSSRAGLAAYYRYKPRRIDQICHDKSRDVEIDTPKIHSSVFERIRENAVSYAPIAIPARYKVVPNGAKFEKPTQAIKRSDDLDRAWDVVFWRRVLYFTFLGTTLLLAGSRFFLDWMPDSPCKGVLCALDPVLNLITKVIPEFLGGWIEALRQNPKWLVAFVAAFGVFSWLKYQLFWKTHSRAETAWRGVKDGATQDLPHYTTPPKSVTSRIRTNKILRGFRDVLTKMVLPLAFFALFMLVVIFGVSRIAFEVRTTAGWVCRNVAPVEFSKDEYIVKSFRTKEPCHATGLMLNQGERYKVTVDVTEKWTDGDIAAGPGGFERTKDTFRLAMWVPTRRSWSQPWFRLMGRIGTKGKDRFPITAEPMTAQSSGQLFLFVNDAVCGFCPGKYAGWPYFWSIGENKGQAQITITRLP